jgi:hypothetical protein
MSVEQKNRLLAWSSQLTRVKDLGKEEQQAMAAGFAKSLESPTTGWTFVLWRFEGFFSFLFFSSINLFFGPVFAFVFVVELFPAKK